MSEITHHTDYRQALAVIKQRIQVSQTRAVLAVNAELLGLYWDIGRQLDAWQRERAWGSAVVAQMAAPNPNYDPSKAPDPAANEPRERRGGKAGKKRG